MRKTWLLPATFAVLATVAPNMARAVPATCAVGTSPRCTVAAGTDYFETLPGTFADIGGVTVDFAGVPFGPGATDTTVQRTADAVINGAAVPLLLTGLQLESTNLSTRIFVSLNPLIASTGSMSIAGNLSGGTFSSTLDVNFDVCTAPGVKGVGCGTGHLITTGSFSLSNTGATWSPTPPKDAELVRGKFGDVLANLHTGLPCNVDECEVDSFAVSTVFERAPSELHKVKIAPVPEPTTIAILGIGLLGVGLVKRRRS